MVCWHRDCTFWLALWLGTRIVSGKPVWKVAVQSSTVLYLCLEDNQQRIQNRLSEMVGGEADNFSSLHFSTEAQILTVLDRGDDTGLLRQLHKFTDKHPDTRLIIIDTLQKVRTTADVSYGCDYNDLSLLKSFADRHRLTVLVIHHLSLRHSNASLLIAGGADVATVAGLLGHSQPSTTLDIYTHTFDKNKKAASEA